MMKPLDETTDYYAWSMRADYFFKRCRVGVFGCFICNASTLPPASPPRQIADEDDKERQQQ